MKKHPNTDNANSAKTYKSEVLDNLMQQSQQQEYTAEAEIDNENNLEGPQQVETSEMLKKTLQKVQEELLMANDKYLRLYAEFENFRKRTIQEKLALMETAGEKILQQILPVIDDFERALAALKQENISVHALEEGVKLIHDKLIHILEQAGVQLMQLEKGSLFDSELHEAITKTPVTDSALQGKVVDIIEKGYLLKNKVLRHAKVIIGA